MKLSAAVTAVATTLRRRPADLLPFYVLGIAVPAITRVGTFLGLAVGYLYLETTGRLETVRGELASRDLSPPDPEAQPEAFAEWAADLDPVLEALFPPAVVGILAVTAVVTVIAALLLHVGVAAGQLAACDARLRDERGLSAGIAGVRRHWLSFLGLFVLEASLWIVAALAAALFAGAVALAIVVLTGETAIGVLAALLGFVLWIVVVAVVRGVFAFAPVAVVVDDGGIAGSLTGSLGFLRRRPVEAVFYYVSAIAAIVGFAGIFSLLSAGSAGSLGSLVVALVVFPALDLLKTTLYGAYRGSISPPSSPGRTLRAQLAAGVRRGLTELSTFVRDAPGVHVVTVAVTVAGFAAGWLLAGPFVGVVETSIAARLEGHFPPTAAIQLFVNNWTVALTTAYAGVVLAVPAAASLAFNGFAIGIYARLEVDLPELIAFILPHGILEIPAIVVAGALGIHLGVVAWQTIRGRLERSVAATELERAFWVLVGIGLVLAVAALVEGFVSPYYYRLV